MKEILVIALTILFVDIIWISTFMGKMFSPMIENIQKSPMIIRPLGGILAYAAMIALFYMFRKDLTLLKAFALGAAVFATYDFTSYALFTGWDLKIAVVDTIWGGVLFLITKVIYDMVCTRL